ncbi:serpin family protein [Paenibacillus sp. QZ-Y1]|uniref:serpin family protein n=1 Tax=Paenibacillus sp. QZ-Y1 TaxID=3414511 RepID=UPI003F7A6A4F
MESNVTQELTEAERNAALKAIETKHIQAMNTMGLRILQQMGVKEQAGGNNLLISPYSIAAAIGMAYNGSEGETQREMEKVMSWSGLTREQVNSAQAALQQLLAHPGEGIQMNLANSLWVKDGLTLEAAYTSTLQESYDAEIRELDGQPEQARQEINQWVKQRTAGMIPEMMQQPPEVITLMVLLNAIAFDGNWMDEFDPERTQDSEFNLANGNVMTVPMMHQSKQFSYAENEDWQAIELPYGKGQMHLLVVLPKEGRTLAQVQQLLLDDPRSLNTGADFRLVELSLPRFRVEYGSDLNWVFQQLGMQTAFDRTRADFRNMSSSALEKQLHIGKVLHRAVMEVNEQGTLAAASTLLEMRAGSAPPTESVKMDVNRPFMVAVVDHATDAWVFAGVINQPEQIASR